MEKTVIGTIEGAWTDVVANLHAYYGEDDHGSFIQYTEYVYATPWSSGPMYFIALKDNETGDPVPDSLWTDEEMGGF
jgi:hypothetical protein